MPDVAPDRAARVRAALEAIHRDYGATGLDSPAVIDNAIDDGPDRVLLRAAAAARVGDVLAGRFAGAPADASADASTDASADASAEDAIREVVAGKPADIDGDEWRFVVEEYARVLGHPITAAPTFHGRATPRTQPNRGRVLDDTTAFDIAAGLPRLDYARRRRSIATPLIVGIAIAVVIAAAVTVIVYVSTGTPCRGGICAADAPPSPTRSAATATPTTPAPTQAVAANVPPLSAVMPADVDLPTCRTTDDDPFLDNVIAYYACQAGATARLPYLHVWGYQFRDQATYAQGVDAFNAFVKFDPTAAEGRCPPVATYGSVRWHTLATPDVESGTLECYSDSSENHYYVWTDDSEYTIIVAESGPEQAFAQLDAWWHDNNRNT
ncbi:MAG TPA: hypothetical protein VFR11_20640 [Micromonosporaceae bacterium]|nr:hypothetical protein [Micromonosporaceae bacterium]